jgi:hypothetical protein
MEPNSEQPQDVTSEGTEPTETAESTARSTSARDRKKKRARRERSERELAARRAREKRSRRIKTIAVVAVVAIAAVVFFLMKRTERSTRWEVGNEVPVEITLIAADATNLACASPAEIAGKHCAFETTEQPSSKSGASDDRLLLKPYTTTDGRTFLAAGLWTQPALTQSLPAARFTVRCRFAIEGKVTGAQVRWLSAGPWNESGAEWVAGTLKDCKQPTAGK